MTRLLAKWGSRSVRGRALIAAGVVTTLAVVGAGGYLLLVEGELAPRDERRLAGHAELCPDCAYLIATLEVLLGILPALRLPPDLAFAIAERTAERVRARIEECG